MTSTTKTVRGNVAKTGKAADSLAQPNKTGNAAGSLPKPNKTGNAAGSLPKPKAQSKKPDDDTSSIASSGSIKSNESTKSYKDALLTKPINALAALRLTNTPKPKPIMPKPAEEEPAVEVKPVPEQPKLATTTPKPAATATPGGNRAQRRAPLAAAFKAQRDRDAPSDDDQSPEDPSPDPDKNAEQEHEQEQEQEQDPEDPDPEDPDPPQPDNDDASSSSSASSSDFKVAKDRRRGTKHADRRTKLDGLIPARDLQHFQRTLASVVPQYKGDALATAYLAHVIDAVVSALSPIVRLPDDIAEAAAMVKGWVTKPDTLPRCAVALGGPIADLLRRTTASNAYSPVTKPRALARETIAMLSAAFPVHVNQQAGWLALGRIELAYKRLARSIRSHVLGSLRDMRIAPGEDARSLLDYIASMSQYGEIAFASTATEEAQDMLYNILIATLTDDDRFAAFVPAWYAQVDDSELGSPSFDMLCDILRTHARMMTSRTIQRTTTRREPRDQPRQERAYLGTQYNNNNQRDRRSPSPFRSRPPSTSPYRRHPTRDARQATTTAQQGRFKQRQERARDHTDHVYLGQQVPVRPPSGPWCGRCNAPHTIDECKTVVCRRCGKAGHIAKSCPATTAGTGPRADAQQQSARPAKHAREQSKPRRIDNDEHRSYLLKADATEDTWTYSLGYNISLAATARRPASPARLSSTHHSPALLFDTCSSQHVTGCLHAMHNVKEIKTERAYGFGITEINRAGAALIHVAHDNGAIHNIMLPLVKYAPSLGTDVFILSVRRLLASGYAIDLDAVKPFLTTPDGETVPLSWRNNLLVTDAAELTMLGSGDRTATEHPSVWHGRFSHLSDNTVRKIAQHCTGVHDLPHTEQEPCLACVQSKMQQRAISKSPDMPPHQATRPLDVLAIDLCGPLPDALNHARYNVVIVDLFSRHKWCIAVRRKTSDTLARAFEEYLAYAHRARGINDTPRLVVSDGAPELIGPDSAFAALLRRLRVAQSYNPRASSRLNSVVERAHNTIMTGARALMHHGNAPVSWWHWMARYSCTTSNFIPAAADKPSAHEVFTGRKPDASRLRTMLCRAYILDHDRESKLAARATPGILVGLGPEPGTYIVRLDRNGETIATRSLFLLESNFPLYDRKSPPEARAQLNLLTPAVPSQPINEDDSSSVSSNSSSSSASSSSSSSSSSSTNSPPSQPANSTSQPPPSQPPPNRRTRRQPSRYDPATEAARPQWQGTATFLGAAHSAHSRHTIPHGGASRGGASRGGASAPSQPNTTNLFLLPILNTFIMVADMLLTAATICLHTMSFFLTSCARVAHLGLSGPAAQLTGGMAHCTCPTDQLHARTINSRTQYSQPNSRHISPQPNSRHISPPQPDSYKSPRRPNSSFPSFYGSVKSVKPSAVTAVPSVPDVYSRPEPPSAKAALSGIDAAPWREAFTAEWDMLWSRGTFKWELAAAARGRVITSTWVLKTKSQQRKLKARLVARGCQQTSWPETYAPTAASTHMRILLALAAMLGLEVHCLDWRSAYLYATLPPGTVIYMRPPFPYDRPGYVLRLIKSLYGLKQAGNLYYRLARDTNRKFGLAQSIYDPAFSFGSDMLASSHVDDVMICGQPDKLRAYVSFLQNQGFDIAVENPVKSYLGIDYKVNTERTSYELRQTAAISKIIKDHGVEDLPARRTPAPLDIDISELRVRTPEDPEPSLPYRAAVGSLMYLAVNARPDIMFVTCSLARYLTNFTAEHYGRAQHVIRYLKGTADLPLVISKERLGNGELSAWVDADWATCKTTRRSVTGYVVCIGDVPVVWASSRQTSVASSSCEAEYAAISDCVRRVVELRNFLTSIGRRATRPTVVRTDAQSAIDALHGPVIAQRLRHIDIRMHRTRQAIDDGDIEIVKVPTDINRADGFTKVLPRSKFEAFFHHQLMGAVNIPTTTSQAKTTTPRGASQVNATSGITVEEPLPGSATHAPGSALHVHWQPGHKRAELGHKRAPRARHLAEPAEQPKPSH